MRKSLFFLLLTSAAVPAFAADENSDRAARREAIRAERAEVRSERQAERSQRSIRVAPPAEPRSIERRGADLAPARELRREAIERPVLERSTPRMVEVESARPTLERRREAVEERVRERRGPRIVEIDSDAPRPTLEQRREVIDGLRELPRRRADRPVLADNPIANPIQLPAEARPEIPAPTPAVATASHSAKPWRSSWRYDNRYDWKRHRNHHRSLFRLGFYFDPFGWSYYRWPIGWRLWPSYYRSSFWLHDPWMYRLPPGYGPYRWVRYWDDALLVNIYTGQVVDVIHNFFW
jgi:Ni/Co efflux regulator RcnB